MIERSLNAFEARQVDALCDRFESQLVAGEEPEIEQFLAEVDESVATHVLRELLALELAYRAKTGETLNRHEYRKQYRERFKDQAAVVDTAIDGFDSDTAVFLDADQGRSQRQLPVPFEFGNYVVLEEIAQGGMGVVYKARQKNPDRLVALKMIRTGELAGDEEVARFEAEANAAAWLDHPNIVPIYEAGELDGQHFFSMGYVEGRGLDERLQDGPIAPRETAKLVFAIADAVQYAHEQGVIHRDLKPSNVLLDSDGVPRVTDFGLAKRVDADRSLTLPGEAMGTPSFMPPEQARGDLERIGPRSDVYSLGATLYCLLTARPPFQASSVMETMRQVVEQDPVSPRELNRAVERDLETICLKCLEKESDRRYATAAEVSAELQFFLDGRPIAARPVGRWERARRWSVRNPLSASLVAAVVMVFIAGFAGVSHQWWRAEENYREVLKQKSATEAALADAQEQRKKKEAETERAKKERDRAERNLREAIGAVFRFYTQVSESPELLRGHPGTQELRRKLLARARDYFSRFVKQNEGDLNLTYELVAAYYRLGTMYFETSELKEAEESFDRVVALCKPHQKEARFREELAAAYLSLSSLHHHAGRSQKRVQYQRKAMNAFAALMAEFPKEINYRYKHAFCQFTMSLVDREEHRYAEALGWMHKCIPTFQQLLKKIDSDELRARLAGAHCYRAVALTASGQLDKANADYGEAMRILKSLKSKRPMGPETDLLLADCRLWMGIHHRERNRLTAALAEFDAAIALAENRRATSPRVARFSVVVGLGCDYKASVLKDLKRWKDALQVAGRAIDVFKKLTARKDAPDQTWLYLARGFQGRALIYRERRDFSRSAADFQEAVEIQERLHKKRPEFEKYAEALARTLGLRGTLFNMAGRFDKAIANYDRAIELIEPLYKKTKSRKHAELLSNIHGDKGLARLKQGQSLPVYLRQQKYTQASAEYAKALKILKPLVTNPKYKQVLSLQFSYTSLLGNHGIIFERQGKLGEALACHDEAIQIRLKLKTQSSTLGIRTSLGGSYCNRGNVQRLAGDRDMALKSYALAINELTGVLAEAGQSPVARQFLVNSYSARAMTHRANRHYDKEAADWENALAKCHPKQRVFCLLQCVSALARIGKHDRVFDLIKKHLNTHGVTPVDRYMVARVCAWFASIAQSKKDPPDIVKRYQNTALALLRAAARYGLFEKKRILMSLKSDPYFSSLRQLKEFKALIDNPSSAKKCEK